ncbi:Mu transposase domain-containing protein [Paralimibaculum aggregatum]|uniref:Mu transposase domain-containing protein n=1 Tax=Paralimibaculum aggregatum TaxID=3036245 RepID=UPI003DA19497
MADRTGRDVFGPGRPSHVPCRSRIGCFPAVPVSVSETCLLRVDGNAFPLPASVVGRHVETPVRAVRIEIRRNGWMLGEHRRAFDRGRTVHDPWRLSFPACASGRGDRRFGVSVVRRDAAGGAAGQLAPEAGAGHAPPDAPRPTSSIAATSGRWNMRAAGRARDRRSEFARPRISRRRGILRKTGLPRGRAGAAGGPGVRGCERVDVAVIAKSPCLSPVGPGSGQGSAAEAP